MEWQNKSDLEIEFLKKVFDVDNKNYHAWSYRIWLCEHFNIYESELKEVEYYIEEDIGNNSAWSYRYFIYYKLGITLEKLKSSELPYIFRYLLINFRFIFEKIKIDPTNEASWNYLKG